MSRLPYRQLDAWKRSRLLAIEIDRETKREAFRGEPNLRDQMRRAAFSVGANIAEGNGRSTPLDYAAFIDRARGSLFELDHWLVLCGDLNLIPVERQETYSQEISEISAMRLALARSNRSRKTLPSRHGRS